MAIPLGFLTRFAIPLIVAAIHLGDINIPEQMQIFDKTERLSDEALSKARGEGDGNEIFDYIIVGGGSSGAVVANRLSANGANTVLLLEAGGDPNPIFEVPYAQGYFWGMDINKWDYSTVKQEYGCAGTDGICPEPKGKGLGGGSSINALIYNRCKPKDFDLWANFTGDQAWSWANIKDTFNSIEDYHGFYEDTHNGRHGEGGEMYVGRIDYTPGVEVLEEALREKGYPIGDLNGGEDFTYGWSKMDFNIKDGLRWGTYQAFLEPILNRTNLFIYRHAYATKILIAPGDLNHRATGVEYIRHGMVRRAEASKEVIVAAGAIESPKLLMLSGLGPKDELERLDIEVVVDLPVGKYQQEHPSVTLTIDGEGFRVNTTFAESRNTTENLLEFVENGTGPLNAFQFGGASHIMMGYLTSSQNPDLTWPELHAFAYQKYYEGENRQEFYFSVQLARMESSGSVTLASNDPADKPVIDPKLFDDLNDVEKLVDGIEQMMDIYMNSEAFRKIGIEDLKVYEPCRSFEFKSREYWRCVVMQTASPNLHPTSSCRMGPDRTVAALDSRLKVFGMQNLRVIDASSMPFVPSGNINLPAMLMGARGAEIILNEM